MYQKKTTATEYAIKLAALRELEDALRYKRKFEDLAHSFLGIYGEFLEYCKANRLEIPDIRRHDRILENARKTISPELGQPDDITGNRDRSEKGEKA